MKTLIRPKIFETNSSSVHSLAIMSEYDYEEWKRGEKYWNEFDGGIYTLEEVIERSGDNMKTRIKYYQEEMPEKLEEYLSLSGYYTYGSWNPDDRYADRYEESLDHYVSESGDRIVIRSKFGYNG